MNLVEIWNQILSECGGDQAEAIEEFLKVHGDEALTRLFVVKTGPESPDNTTTTHIEEPEPGTGYFDWFSELQKSPSWTLFLTNLKKLNKSEKEQLKKDTAAITNACLGNPDPNDRTKIAGAQHRTGLVMGDVQAGKTTSIQAVIAATKEKYQCYIILTSRNEALRAQTAKRLFTQFTKENKWQNHYNPRFDQDYKRGDNYRLTLTDGPNVFVTKKIGHNIQKVLEFISQSQAIASQMNALIIDDEADDASINTNTEHKPTPTNKLIRQLRNHFRSTTYCAYTATPFANLVIDADNEEDLYPRHFGLTVRAGESYVGLRRMFAKTGDLQSAVVPTDGNISLFKLLLRFILASSLKYIRWENSDKDLRDNSFYATALFNSERLQTVHSNLARSIAFEMMRIHKLLFSKDGVTKDTNAIGEEWNALKSHIENFRKPSTPFAHSPFKLPDLDEVLSTARKNIVSEEIETIQLPDGVNPQTIEAPKMPFIALHNTEGGDRRLDYDNSKKQIVIVVGGDALSRGLTLEGLILTLFDRKSARYDSFLQMARWFGYRPDYLDLCTVYMPEDARKRYKFLAGCVDTLKQDLIDALDQGLPPDEVRPLLVLPGDEERKEGISSNFKPTGRIAKDAKPKEIRNGESQFQSHTLYSDLEPLNRNLRALKELFAGQTNHSFEATNEQVRNFLGAFNCPGDPYYRLHALNVYEQAPAQKTKWLVKLVTIDRPITKIQLHDKLEADTVSRSTITEDERRGSGIIRLASLADGANIKLAKQALQSLPETVAGTLLIYIVDKNSKPADSVTGRFPLNLRQHAVGIWIYTPGSPNSGNRLWVNVAGNLKQKKSNTGVDK